MRIMSEVDRPGYIRTSLTKAQVRMILRIIWVDRYQRRAKGLNRGTIGVHARIAKQFSVSIGVVKKIAGLKENQHRRKPRARFKTIAIKSIKRHVQTRLGIKRGKAGKP